MKNGFTMIELIVSIAIIMLLTVLVFPSIVKLNNETREKEYDAKIKIILSSAKEWGTDNLNDLSDECTNIFVRDLINGGYMDGDDEEKSILLNPINNESMNNEIVCVTYEHINGKYQINTVMVEWIWN